MQCLLATLICTENRKCCLKSTNIPNSFRKERCDGMHAGIISLIVRLLSYGHILKVQCFRFYTQIYIHVALEANPCRMFLFKLMSVKMEIFDLNQIWIRPRETMQLFYNNKLHNELYITYNRISPRLKNYLLSFISWKYWTVKMKLNVISLGPLFWHLLPFKDNWCVCLRHFWYEYCDKKSSVI